MLNEDIGRLGAHSFGHVRQEVMKLSDCLQYRPYSQISSRLSKGVSLAQAHSREMGWADPDKARRSKDEDNDDGAVFHFSRWLSNSMVREMRESRSFGCSQSAKASRS